MERTSASDGSRYFPNFQAEAEYLTPPGTQEESPRLPSSSTRVDLFEVSSQKHDGPLDAQLHVTKETKNNHQKVVHVWPEYGFQQAELIDQLKSVSNTVSKIPAHKDDVHEDHESNSDLGLDHDSPHQQTSQNVQPDHNILLLDTQSGISLARTSTRSTPTGSSASDSISVTDEDFPAHTSGYSTPVEAQDAQDVMTYATCSLKKSFLLEAIKQILVPPTKLPVPISDSAVQLLKWNFGLRQHTGTGTSDSSSKTQSTNNNSQVQSSVSTSIASMSTYSRASNYDELERDRDGDFPRKRRKLQTVTGEGPKGRRFACPFFKRRPESCMKHRACAGPGWETVHRVKEHIYRVHARPPFCARCNQVFHDEELLYEHIRMIGGQQCAVVDNAEPPMGFTKKHEDKLRSRKNFTGKSEIEQWSWVYSLIFPDDEYIPTPCKYLSKGLHVEMLMQSV
jgi:hypothetical protein